LEEALVIPTKVRGVPEEPLQDTLNTADLTWIKYTYIWIKTTDIWIKIADTGERPQTSR
jgi:hypothetical protein